jgi:hypothetical protein
MGFFLGKVRFLVLVKVAGTLDGFWLGEVWFLALVKVAGALHGVWAGSSLVFSLSESG